MNCKKDDFAIVVRSEAGNEGKTLTCLQLFPAGHDDIDISLGPIWETDRNDILFLQFGCVGYGRFIPDSFVRPIRDQPGNEAFVTEARNKLKGKTEITERGELRV
ncbi:MAG: hypothetical protein V4858_17095 [Pseudomonadota bacterium]